MSPWFYLASLTVSCGFMLAAFYFGIKLSRGEKLIDRREIGVIDTDENIYVDEEKRVGSYVNSGEVRFSGTNTAGTTEWPSEQE